MTEFRGSELVPSYAGEYSNGIDGTDDRRAAILARARETIRRVELLVTPAEPQAEETFDLDAYLKQFPRPINGSVR